MIAVFWDNADFSRGVGTTFYQVSEATWVHDGTKHLSVINSSPILWMPLEMCN